MNKKYISIIFGIILIFGLIYTFRKEISLVENTYLSSYGSTSQSVCRADVNSHLALSGCRCTYTNSCNALGSNGYYSAEFGSGTECLSGSSCRTGFTCNSACSSSCIDTDGGLNWNIKGTVTSAYGSVGTDNCPSTNSLLEFSCSGSNGITTPHECLYGCTNGACKPEPKCTDSDGGKNAQEVGTVIDAEGVSKTDYCYSKTQLFEAYCGSDKLYYYMEMSCPSNNICLGGACNICNQCSPEGNEMCNGNLHSVCAKDSNGCLKWSSESVKVGKCDVECTSNSNCQTGYTCNANKKCVTNINPCDGVICNSFCQGNTYKYNGQCNTGNCVYNSYNTCGSNQICTQTGCIDQPQCTLNTQCPIGYKCLNEVCTRDTSYCFVDTDCKSYEFCDTINHSCKLKTDNTLIYIIIGASVGLIILVLFIILLVRNIKKK